jgi:GNAT superfamily N-acetyltransferase
MELELASDEEKGARDGLTFAAWGGGLTLPQFLEREVRLREQAWARQRMQTWLLKEGARVLASCETFRNDSYLDGRAGHSWSIASVFTEEALRGKGHALELMRRLRERLRPEPGAQACVLFSEVGPQLYERAGYRALAGATDQVLPALDAPLPESVEPVEGPPMRPALVTGPGLVLWPSAEQLDWHLERARLYARYLGRRPLDFDSATCEGARAVFCAYYKTNELLVLWLEGRPFGFEPLLRCAQVLAHRSGLARVRLWEDPELALPLLGERVRRGDELPMVAAWSGAPRWRQVQRALWV